MNLILRCDVQTRAGKRKLSCPFGTTRRVKLRSRKTVRYSEQIMSADKYPSIFSRQMEAIVYIFSPQMEAIVFIILQIFFATRAVLKIGEAGEYVANSLARNIANKASRS